MKIAIVRRVTLVLGLVLLVIAAMKFEQRRSGTGGFQPVQAGTVEAMDFLAHKVDPRESSEPWYWLAGAVGLIAVSIPLGVGAPRHPVPQV